MMTPFIALILAVWLAGLTPEAKPEALLLGWDGGTGKGYFIFWQNGRRFACAWDKEVTRKSFDGRYKRLAIGRKAILEFVRPEDPDEVPCLATSVRFLDAYEEKLVAASKLATDFLTAVDSGRYKYAHSLLSSHGKQTLNFDSLKTLGTSLIRFRGRQRISTQNLVVSQYGSSEIEVIVDPVVLLLIDETVGVRVTFEQQKAVVSEIRVLPSSAFSRLFE